MTHEKHRMSASLVHLHKYRTEGGSFLRQIVASNVKSYHNFVPTEKPAGMQQKHATSARTKKFFPVTSIHQQRDSDCLLQHLGALASGLQ
jgi:hypothetical protein